MDSQPLWWLSLKSRLKPREGAPATVRRLPGTWLPPCTMFVPMATKQCHTHTPSHSPWAAPSSERSPTKFPLGRPVPNLGTQSFSTSPKPEGQSQVRPPPPIRNFPDTSARPASIFPRKKTAAAAALGKAWTARDLSAHLALSGLWAPA